MLKRRDEEDVCSNGWNRGFGISGDWVIAAGCTDKSVPVNGAQERQGRVES